MAARTQRSPTRQSLVFGGLYAFIGAVGLAFYFIAGGRGSGHDFVPPIFSAIISVGFLGLAGWCVIPVVVSYRRERGGRNAASKP